MSKQSSNISYKDRRRHGGKRTELIKENGLICSECGKKGNRFQIVTHHSTFNNQDHSAQELLCRACHCRIHHSFPKKNISKEEIVMALDNNINITAAQRALGISKETFFRKRKEYNLV